jgi:hypothetical protein
VAKSFGMVLATALPVGLAWWLVEGTSAAGSDAGRALVSRELYSVA